MARSVSKTRIASLTREIRREAKSIDSILASLDLVAKGRGETLVQTSHSFPGAVHLIAESLGVIDGNSAQIRELLGLEGY